MKTFFLFSLLAVTCNCSERFIITLKDYEESSENNINPIGEFSRRDLHVVQTETFSIGKLNGFIIETEDSVSHFLDQMHSMFLIESIEKDTEVSVPEIIKPTQLLEESNIDPYQWGIDRIDQTDLPLDRTYNPPFTGQGTYVYVLDTGVRPTHDEFEDRVEYGSTQFTDAIDRHGHGTHVMSTVLGKNVGVAKKARGVGVKVLSDSGSGSTSGVIKGIEWAVNDIKNKKRCGIISMSLGGGRNTALNNAVNAANEEGIPVVVAAGNSNRDACFESPSSAEGSITVGSSTVSDVRSSFSNTGQCVNIFAPGSSIIGASVRSDSGYITLSGTSMACPHVSGAISMLLGHNRCNVGEVRDYIENRSLENKLIGVGTGSPNKLLQVQTINTGPPTPIPTESPTQSPTMCPTESPTYSRDFCEKECNTRPNKCLCFNNKLIGGVCRCYWARRRPIGRKCYAKANSGSFYT